MVTHSIECRCQSSTGTDEAKTAKQMNLLDNASNMLTNFLSGAKILSMPTAEGAVSDLFGKPLFFSLYDWFIEVDFMLLLSCIGLNCLINGLPISNVAID